MAKLKEIIGEELFKQLPKEKQTELEKQDLEDVSEGKYVPKARFDQVNSESKEYKKQVGERDTQITNLKEEFKDAKGLKEKVEELEADNKKKDDDYQAKINTIKKENAIEKALGEYKCKNKKVVRALLDEEKLIFKDDEISGLKEQMEAIQKDNDYLFEKEAAPGTEDFIPGGEGKDPKDKKEFGEQLAESKIEASKQAENLSKFFS